MKRYQYRVCQVQSNRVTFVNGKWTGTLPPEASNFKNAMETCPRVWEYLNTAGEQGWELITSTPIKPDAGLVALYLRKGLYLLG